MLSQLEIRIPHAEATRNEYTLMLRQLGMRIPSC
jgi:hypothetical protein